MAPQASDIEILAAITKTSTGLITFDVDKAAALINVARKTLENRLAGLKKEHKINVKTTSGVRKAVGRQRKPGANAKNQLERMDRGSQGTTGHDGTFEADGAEQSGIAAEM